MNKKKTSQGIAHLLSLIVLSVLILSGASAATAAIKHAPAGTTAYTGRAGDEHAVPNGGGQDNLPVIRPDGYHELLKLPLPPAEAPVITRIPTSKPVVFLAIDDGLIKDKAGRKFIADRRWPVTLFLTDEIIAGDYGYFREMQLKGAVIEDHTITHTNLTTLPFEGQKKEICATADSYQKKFGVRPRLMRPPGGDYNQDTKKAAAACGMHAVVNWHSKVNGGSLQYQEGDKLLPGDIVLMHFRKEFMDDLKAFQQQVKRDHMHVALLEDWIDFETASVALNSGQN